jgi:hypothetical protein
MITYCGLKLPSLRTLPHWQNLSHSIATSRRALYEILHWTQSVLKVVFIVVCMFPCTIFLPFVCTRVVAKSTLLERNVKKKVATTSDQGMPVAFKILVLSITNCFVTQWSVGGNEVCNEGSQRRALGCVRICVFSGFGGDPVAGSLTP